MTNDAELLRRYAERRDEFAFAELVNRHIGLVYSAAYQRLGGDAQTATETTQIVFTALARDASKLARHTSLPGWLYTATRNTALKTLRAEQRRKQREMEAHVMQEIARDTASSAEWERLRPVLDEAVDSLNATDREAVLMRFFSSRSFADIGAALGLSEDATRMRVDRALEKLQTALTRRGLTSTSAALATILAGNAAIGASVGLSVQISGTALSLAATGAVVTGSGSVVTTTTFLQTMTASKIAVGAAIFALAFAGYQTHRLSQTRIEIAALRDKASAAHARTQQMEGDLAAEHRKAREADEDNVHMLAAVEIAKAEIQALPAKADDTPITTDFVNIRYKRGQSLAKSGDYDAALRDLLWCFDTGMRQTVGFGGVRGSFLLSALAELGKNHPPALAALRDRRDTAEHRFAASRTDADALMDLSAINSALGENARNVALFDSLPAEDDNRRFFVHHIADQLIEARRYKDLADAMPYSHMNRMFDLTAGSIDTMPEAKRAEIKQHVSSSTAQNIEVLAGAGDFAHARELLEKIVAFDNSSETKTLLARHLARAGHPELLQR